ncbi:MAG: GldG family protein [Methylacidiphilales bacterium]|nr:GldG family protein [Candidatus Methylacidiphilales bacterium]
MKSDTPSARSSRHSAGLHSIAKVILAAAIVVMINYAGFKRYYHQDLSASQYYTLSPKTVDELKALDSPITIYTYLDESKIAPTEQITTLLKEYLRVGKKNIIVEKIDPVYDPAEAAKLQNELHFDGADHLVIFKYKDHAPRFVKEDDLFETDPMTGQIASFKGEQQLTAAIIALVEGKPSRIYFTEGHGEHSIEDATSPQGYGAVAATLKDENVETAQLNLAEKGDVPSDADAVVIAGPSVSFSPIEAQALDRYLANNGKLLVLLDPYVVLGLDGLLKKYDMSYDDDLVLYRGTTAAGAQVTVPLAPVYQGGFSTTHPITAKFAQTNIQLLIYDARSITLPPVAPGQPQSKTQFLLQTDADSWGWISKNGAVPADPKQLTFNKVTDIPGPLTIAAVYDGGTTTDPATKATLFATRVIAVGSSKFLENDTAEPVGANFFTNSLDWLVKKNAVLDIAPKKPQEYGVSLNPISYRTVVWCSLFFIPGAALLLGIVTWFSRRK